MFEGWGDFLAGGGVPQPRRTVLAGSDYVPPVRTEHRMTHDTLVFEGWRDGLAGDQIVHPREIPFLPVVEIRQYHPCPVLAEMNEAMAARQIVVLEPRHEAVVRLRGRRLARILYFGRHRRPGRLGHVFILSLPGPIVLLLLRVMHLFVFHWRYRGRGRGVILAFPGFDGLLRL